MREILKRVRTPVSAVAMLAAAALVGSITAAAEGDASAAGLSKRLERLRNATGAYHNEAIAIGSGFASTDACVASPQGGMGYHYVNESRVRDGVVNRDKPEILLYAPAPGNERRLVGVEYFKADEDQDLSTDADRPKLFGRPFDGPMPGHEPGMPVHYDLHVWVWRATPGGLFARFNPRVSCPG